MTHLIHPVAAYENTLLHALHQVSLAPGMAQWATAEMARHCLATGKPVADLTISDLLKALKASERLADRLHSTLGADHPRHEQPSQRGTGRSPAGHRQAGGGPDPYRPVRRTENHGGRMDTFGPGTSVWVRIGGAPSGRAQEKAGYVLRTIGDVIRVRLPGTGEQDFNRADVRRAN
jgi:hypothetical protein